MYKCCVILIIGTYQTGHIVSPLYIGVTRFDTVCLMCVSYGFFVGGSPHITHDSVSQTHTHTPCQTVSHTHTHRKIFSFQRNQDQVFILSGTRDMIDPFLLAGSSRFKRTLTPPSQVYCAFIGFSNSRSSEDTKQIFSSFMLSISSVVMSYLQSPTPMAISYFSWTI